MYIDPMGLSKLTIFQDGKVISLDNPTATQLVNTLKNLPNSSVTNFQIAGHGNNFSQCISAGTGCSDFINENLNIVGSGKRLGNLADLLKDKLSSNGEVNLEGCNNASGGDNITKRLSDVLPEVPVTGGDGYQLGYENHWLFGNSASSFGFKRTYLNGQ